MAEVQWAPTLNGLAIRKRLGRALWGAPQPYGPDGWTFQRQHRAGSIIVSVCPWDGDEWIHASIAFDDLMPTYGEMVHMHRAVFPGYAYEVFAPPEDHINIHEHARHLWGLLDGRRSLPDFARLGSI